MRCTNGPLVWPSLASPIALRVFKRRVKCPASVPSLNTRRLSTLVIHRHVIDSTYGLELTIEHQCIHAVDAGRLYLREPTHPTAMPKSARDHCTCCFLVARWRYLATCRRCRSWCLVPTRGNAVLCRGCVPLGRHCARSDGTIAAGPLWRAAVALRRGVALGRVRRSSAHANRCRRRVDTDFDVKMPGEGTSAVRLHHQAP